MTTSRPFVRAGKVWRVLGMVPETEGREGVEMIAYRVNGIGASCGHYHTTQDEAEACPWEPVPPPPVYAGIVRQVRDDRGDVRRWRQATMPWA
jgi:hypothetical protein